jgi:hypothetical protein
MVGYNTSDVLISTDGINWTKASLPSADYWQTVAYGNGVYVAIANSSAAVSVSSDASNWSSQNIFFNQWNSIIYHNNIFITIGTGSMVATSTNGITWTQRSIVGDNWVSIV